MKINIEYTINKSILRNYSNSQDQYNLDYFTTFCRFLNHFEIINILLSQVNATSFEAL